MSFNAKIDQKIPIFDTTRKSWVIHCPYYHFIKIFIVSDTEQILLNDAASSLVPYTIVNKFTISR